MKSGYVVLLIGIVVFSYIIYPDIPIIPSINPSGLLHVSGTNIVNSNGQTIFLYGCQFDYNVAEGGHDYDRGNLNQDSWYNQSDVQRIKAYRGMCIDTNDLCIDDFMPEKGQINTNKFVNTLDKYFSWTTPLKMYYIISFSNLGFAGWGPNAHWLVEGKYGGATDQDTYWQAEIDFYDMNNPLHTDTRQAYIDLWKFIANRYKDNPYVIFNIGTNEPFCGSTKVTLSNAEKISNDYVTYIATVFDAVRSTGAQNLIFVDKPYCWFYTENYQPVNREIVIEDHCYVTLSSSFNQFQSYINGWISKYINTFHKPFFLGEYGFIDYGVQSGINHYFPNWQQVLQNIINYLKTLPLCGYDWHEYPCLHGEWYDWYYATYHNYDSFTLEESNWILQTVLN